MSPKLTNTFEDRVAFYMEDCRIGLNYNFSGYNIQVPVKKVFQFRIKS
jgi:hypothetical protein